MSVNPFVSKPPSGESSSGEGAVTPRHMDYEEVGLVDRAQLSRSLARVYGKTYGALVTSCSAALDLSFRVLGIERGALVLLPDNCCHDVPASVLRAGATPLFVSVGEDLVLTPGRVASVAAEHRVAAVIAIHQHGLPCDVAGIRGALGPQTPIIEDAAQAWRLMARSRPIGAASDVVVTSFGDRKPLSIGEGGGAFSDDAAIERAIDRWSPGQRTRTEPVLPWALSGRALRHLPAALPRADALIERRRRFVGQAISRLADAGLDPFRPAPGDDPSWHLLPIRMGRDAALSDFCAQLPEADPLSIGRPYLTPLSDLPMFQGRAAVASQPEEHAGLSRCLLMATDLDASIEPVFDAFLRAVERRRRALGEG